MPLEFNFATNVQLYHKDLTQVNSTLPSENNFENRDQLCH